MLFVGDMYVVIKRNYMIFFSRLIFTMPFFCSLTDWIDESSHKDGPAFEILETADLAKLLKEFYFCVRNKKGERYSRSA